MTIMAHGTMSGMIAYSIWHNPFFAGVAIAMGMYPDLIRLFQEDVDDWSRYNWAHDIKLHWWKPFWNIHIMLDYLMHDKKTGKWFTWVYVVEVLWWCLCAIWVIYNVR